MTWYEKMMEKARAKGKTKMLKNRENNSDYLERLSLIPRWACLFLFHPCIHRIVNSDDPRDGLHDHPWPFLSVILKGGYIEHLEGEFLIKHRKPGDVIFSRAKRFHRLELYKEFTYVPNRPLFDSIVSKPCECWTLFIMGPRIPFMSKWGFKVDGKWWPSEVWLAWRGMQGQIRKKSEVFVKNYVEGLSEDREEFMRSMQCNNVCNQPIIWTNKPSQNQLALNRYNNYVKRKKTNGL